MSKLLFEVNLPLNVVSKHFVDWLQRPLEGPMAPWIQAAGPSLYSVTALQYRPDVVIATTTYAGREHHRVYRLRSSSAGTAVYADDGPEPLVFTLGKALVGSVTNQVSKRLMGTDDQAEQLVTFIRAREGRGMSF